MHPRLDTISITAQNAQMLNTIAQLSGIAYVLGSDRADAFDINFVKLEICTKGQRHKNS